MGDSERSPGWESLHETRFISYYQEMLVFKELRKHYTESVKQSFSHLYTLEKKKKKPVI